MKFQIHNSLTNQILYKNLKLMYDFERSDFCVQPSSASMYEKWTLTKLDLVLLMWYICVNSNLSPLKKFRDNKKDALLHNFVISGQWSLKFNLLFQANQKTYIQSYNFSFPVFTQNICPYINSLLTSVVVCQITIFDTLFQRYTINQGRYKREYTFSKEGFLIN